MYMFNPDDLLFADGEYSLFTDVDNYETTEVKDKWKVLIVDDETEIHSVTKLALGHFTFDGKPLQFISAYSGAEAKDLIKANPDTALILLDVVMEEDDSGLKVSKYIREELNNNLVRIILRTGQAGQAPEERIIVDYDINDYKEKTDLTSQKLFTSVVSSLRSYRDLTIIDSSRKGLRKIIDSFANIFELQSIKDFASTVLTQLTAILHINDDTECHCSSGLVAIKDNQDFYILAASGNYCEHINKKIQDAVPGSVLDCLESALTHKDNIYFDNHLVIYFKSKVGSESLAYFEACRDLTELDKDLVDVFCSNVSAVNEAIISSIRYDSEKHQLLLSESLRELTKNLISTLDLKEVFERLLDSIAQIISYDSALGILKKGEHFEVITTRGHIDLNTNIDLGLDLNEHEIISSIAFSGCPVLIPDAENDTRIKRRVYCEDFVRSLLGVPIIYHGNLFGIIILQSQTKTAFSSKEEGIALTFAGQAGIAIENAHLFGAVNDRNAAVKNLLNNTGQGILSFGEDLLVDEEYSLECINMFGCRIEDINFCTLISPNDADQRKFTEKLIVKTLNESSQSKRDAYLSLLPEEIVINNKNIHIDYKIIKNPQEYLSDDYPENGHNGEKFMVILTDITDKRSLEMQMTQEKAILKMVVKVVVNFTNFSECLKDYLNFCDVKIRDILESKRPLKDIVFEIMRSIHTFKGSFGYLDMYNTFARLHEFECRISEMRNNLDSLTLDNFKRFLSEFNMAGSLGEDLKILNEILGEQFFDQDKVLTIDKEKLMQIEKRAQLLPPSNERRDLLSDIRKLRYKPFKDLLKPYHAYVLKLADKLEKPVNPLKIEGGDILVDAEKYQSFSRSLVHVFNNIMDHGLESAEERIKAGKPELGTIECTVSCTNNMVKLVISDDGRGIDIDKVLSIAASRGIYGDGSSFAISDDEILSLLFKDEVSTSENVTEYSGRGFGLAAVKNEVEKVDGTVRITTKPGEWTQFHFTLVYEEP